MELDWIVTEAILNNKDIVGEVQSKWGGRNLDKALDEIIQRESYK